jgi:uncharacterized protein YbjT (DUF2867 family)
VAALMRVLVAGASGTVGRELTRLLAARGDRVTALVRDPERAEPLRHLGEVRSADALRPHELVGLCDGVESVVSCVGGRLDLGLGQRRGYRVLDTEAARVFTTDCVAPPLGRRRMVDNFEELAGSQRIGR